MKTTSLNSLGSRFSDLFIDVNPPFVWLQELLIPTRDWNNISRKVKRRKDGGSNKKKRSSKKSKKSKKSGRNKKVRANKKSRRSNKKCKNT
jgi:hypothetical protein